MITTPERRDLVMQWLRGQSGLQKVWAEDAIQDLESALELCKQLEAEAAARLGATNALIRACEKIKHCNRHTPLRFPTCAHCQLHARMEELRALLASSSSSTAGAELLEEMERLKKEHAENEYHSRVAVSKGQKLYAEVEWLTAENAELVSSRALVRNNNLCLIAEGAESKAKIEQLEARIVELQHQRRKVKAGISISETGKPDAEED